jgi:hypothetical protein
MKVAGNVSKVLVALALLAAAGVAIFTAKHTDPQRIVALTEVVLATGTVYLALQARYEAREVGQQVRLEREQMDADRMPVVVPSPTPHWTRQLGEYSDNEWIYVLPVKNVGRGVALNVLGQLDFGTADPAPGDNRVVQTAPIALGAGDREDLTIAWFRGANRRWGNMTGELIYEDASGGTWCTRFHGGLTGRRQLITLTVEHIKPVKRADFEWAARVPSALVVTDRAATD